MLETAAFNVDKDKFGEGLLAVFIVASTDEPCGINRDEHMSPKRRFKKLVGN